MLQAVNKQYFFHMILTALLWISVINTAVARKVVINGIDNQELISIVKSNIVLAEKTKTISSDSISVNFLLKNDISMMKDIISSFGYFDAKIEAKVNDSAVVFDVVLGERYRFNDVVIHYNDYPEYLVGITVREVFDIMCIQYDSYTTTRDIADACLKLKEFYKRRGFAFVDIGSPGLKLDRVHKKLKVVIDVQLGDKIIVNNSKVVIRGNQLRSKDRLLESFVRNRIRWNKGDTYDSDVVDQTREGLMECGIFSSIDIKVGDPVKKSAHTSYSDVVVTVEEAKLRDISVGGSFGTTEKFGGLFAWSHYNVDGRGSKFTTLTSITKKIQTQKLQYNIPDLFFKRQELRNQLYATRENVSSYIVKKFGGDSILWHEVARRTKIGLGVCGELSKTTDKIIKNDQNQSTSEHFKAMGVPIGFNLDTTKVYLDPQMGFRCSAMVIPYLCKQNFTTLNAKGSVYIPLSPNKYDNKIVVACYSRLGSIISSKNNSIPRDKMFFGGGSNSIRGYGYQLLGEVNDDKKPLGGKSVFEIGIEPRIKISDNIGFVTFVEGGNVYKTRMPKFSQKMLWGGGIGVRYYTPLGPIRLDVAVPFKRRKTSEGKNIDSMFNIYISIGQAF